MPNLREVLEKLPTEVLAGMAAEPAVASPYFDGLEKLGHPPLLIREPPKRWGSCDASGTVRLNWRVMQVGPRLIDYVVAHELVHLENPQHDGDFWSRLGAEMPDAEARRAKLRRAGVRVGW
jgi:predicted metal-dependent hydrolase